MALDQQIGRVHVVGPLVPACQAKLRIPIEPRVLLDLVEIPAESVVQLRHLDLEMRLLPPESHLLIVYRMDWIAAVVRVVVGTPLVAVLVYRFSRKDADRRVDETRAQAAATVHAARLDADALRLNEEARAREAALELRTTAEVEVSRVSEDLVRREERLGKRRIALEEVQQRIAELSATQKLRDTAAQERIRDLVLEAYVEYEERAASV